ncbi:MAG TPA: hypothetical protein VHW43_00660, partial [Puia sp.]|nr:hypothetical protein [Puia sp.]
FSFSRFRRLVALHWAGNKRLYLLALPAIGGLFAVWYGFLLAMDRYSPLDDGMQAFTYYWGLMLIGCLYSSTIFSQFGSKAQGIAWLGLPASALEKLFCGMLFSAILCFVGYTLLFYVVDIPMVKIGNELIVGQHRVWSAGYPVLPNPVWNLANGLPGDNPDHSFHVFFILYFMLQAAFALGSVYFHRYAFVKTVIVVLLFLLVFQKQSRALIVPHEWNQYTLTNDWITDADTLHVQSVRLSPWITGPLAILVLFGLPTVFWVATYFRIKEKQV